MRQRRRARKGLRGRERKGGWKRKRERDDRSRPVEKGYSRRETTIGRTLGRGWEEERGGETGERTVGLGGNMDEYTES